MEWKNPPRDYRDECEEIAAKLKKAPGRWAQVLKDSDLVDNYRDELKKHGIEIRSVNVREVSSGHPKYLCWDHGDLYARAPEN